MNRRYIEITNGMIEFGACLPNGLEQFQVDLSRILHTAVSVRFYHRILVHGYLGIIDLRHSHQMLGSS